MRTSPFLKLAPERRLVMTFALRQALEILQMPQLELGLWLNGEIEKNPLLEMNRAKEKSRFEREFPATITLYEHLTKQIRDHFEDPREQQRAFHLLHQLDDKGFLPIEVDNGAILSVLQTLDPPGIFARSLQESFLLQLVAKGKKATLAYQLVEHCYEDLVHKRFGVIKKRLKAPHLQEAIKDLSHLSMRPAHIFKDEPTCPITPDLLIQRVDGGWTLELIEEDLPAFQIKEEYLNLSSDNGEEMEALQAFKTQAKWIIRSLDRRRKLLKEIGRLLLQKQASYFDRKGPLAPLNMKELAEKLEVHESTLSRALSGKYAATPRGILPLKSLVVGDHVQLSVKDMLGNLIAGEDKQNPLTDEQLAEALSKQGLKVARRTVAKYRIQLKIGSAQQRKNHF